MPPATVNSAVSRMMNGMYSADQRVHERACRPRRRRSTSANGTRKASAQAAATLPKWWCQNHGGAAAAASAIDSSRPANGTPHERRRAGGRRSRRARRKLREPDRAATAARVLRSRPVDCRVGSTPAGEGGDRLARRVEAVHRRATGRRSRATCRRPASRRRPAPMCGRMIFAKPFQAACGQVCRPCGPRRHHMFCRNMP